VSSPAEGPAPPTGAPAVLDELRRIIRRIEAARPPRPAPEPVEHLVGGRVVETPGGPLVVVRREYPLDHRHGRFSLADALDAASDVLEALAPSGFGPVAAETLLFLDTETTGLAGGTGTYAFLVGAGFVDAGRFVLEQYFMRDFDEEPALLAALDPLLGRAGALVTFNGGGFDLPLLETRFVLARRRWPAMLPHLDLLRPARRVWGASVEDCRLATLERAVLGLRREEDVPGSLIPTLYFDFLRSRRAAPLKRVFAHNRDDVLSLAALLGWFARALEPGAILSAAEIAGLGRLWERTDPERAADCYRRALAAGLDGGEAHRVRLRLARWEKRRARWAAACELWEAARAAAWFDPTPWEELAKYHEHRRRDLAAALAIVREALRLAEAAGASARVLADLAHRLARLERRTSIAGARARSVGRERDDVQDVGLRADPDAGREDGRRRLRGVHAVAGG
jgi:uncharacterized protein YprB with RNaseH-like and TPR domain